MDASYLTVEGECYCGITVLIIRGDLDAAVPDEFAEYAARTVVDLSGPVVVDLSGLTFIDCSGVQALTAAILAIPSWRPVTVVCRPDSIPLRVLDLLSVDLGHLRAEIECPSRPHA
jgi:stage II sporulation protein AA (anti-sigma F factor antagonist)